MKNAFTFFRRAWLVGSVAAACASFSACGDDWELIKNPLHIQGSFDPVFGLPVAYGEITLDSLIGMMSTSNPSIESYITVDENEVLHFHYNFSTSGGFNQTDKKAPATTPVATKDDDWYVYTKDTVISEELPLPFLEGINNEVLDPLATLKPKHVYITITIDATAEAPTDVLPGASLLFDNLAITYKDRYGAVRPLPINNDSINITDLTRTGIHDTIVIDIARLIEDFPSHITVSFRTELSVNTQRVIENFDLMHFIEALDSLEMSNLNYTINTDFDIPFYFSVSGFAKPIDLDLGEGFSSIDLDQYLSELPEGITLDSTAAHLRLAFDNGIPLTLGFTPQFLDGNGMTLPIDVLVFDSIRSAHCVEKELSDGTAYVSDSMVRSVVELRLNKRNLELIKEARTLRLNINIDSFKKQHVAIRPSDKLRIKAYIKLRPGLGFDIPVFDGFDSLGFNNLF